MRFSLRTLLIAVLFTGSIALIVFQRFEMQKLNAKLMQYKSVVDPETLITQEMTGNVEYRLSKEGSHQYYIRFPGKSIRAGNDPRVRDTLMSVTGLGKFTWGKEEGVLVLEARSLPEHHAESIKLFQEKWDELQFEIVCHEYSGPLDQPIELFRIKKNGGKQESIYLYSLESKR